MSPTRTAKARDRWSLERLATLDEQIRVALAADFPQSVRHVFYLMTDPRRAVFVEKDDGGYRRVQRRMLSMRREGSLPYAWVTDTSRSGFFVDTFAGPSAFLAAVAGLYRRDIWTRSNVHVEVWVESRSIAGVLLRDTHELAVTLYPTGGFSSVSIGLRGGVSASTPSYRTAARIAPKSYSWPTTTQPGC